jgi:succinate-semialdehyde dehydrogenase/glutarate-semialdehyde dehydrogenase
MELQMFIGGDWVAAHSGATTFATSPATGEKLGTVPAGDAASPSTGGRRRA